MSRSGYSDDLDGRALARYRGRVASAMRGRRGQKLLRDCLAALDALPEKRLVKDDLVSADGSVCTLGAAGRYRGISDLDRMDPEEHDMLGIKFNVASCLIKEIEFENDDVEYRETPEQRFRRMRRWLVENIKADEVAA